MVIAIDGPLLLLKCADDAAMAIICVLSLAYTYWPFDAYLKIATTMLSTLVASFRWVITQQHVPQVLVGRPVGIQSDYRT